MQTTYTETTGSTFYTNIDDQINTITANKLLKHEYVLLSPQSPKVVLDNGKTLLNFCANNYLGLADNHELISGVLTISNNAVTNTN